MTHPGKNPGMSGYPTPNEIPEDEGYLVFKFPNDEGISQLITGALTPLTYSYNYFEWGDVLPDEISELMREVINDAPYNLLDNSIGTPYWDEDSDVDDEEPKDVQPWYGYVTNPEAPPDELNFVENATIWILTGMLAAATWEIGAAPAILFRTIAPRFAVAMRRGDVGEIVRIFIDGSEAARVDTSSASPGDVIRVKVVGNPDLEEHDLMLVQES